jgi:hypothetical protein
MSIDAFSLLALHRGVAIMSDETYGLTFVTEVITHLSE